MFEHPKQRISDINELSRGVYFRFNMVFNNFQKFLENIKAIFNVLTNDIPLFSKLMILLLNFIVLSEDPLI